MSSERREPDLSDDCTFLKELCKAMTCPAPGWYDEPAPEQPATQSGRREFCDRR